MNNDNFLEAFVITNNRSSLKYCMDSVSRQDLNIQVTTIEGMSFVDANNKALKMCKSKFYFRIDDDFLLNKYAFSFMNDTIRANDYNNIILYDCRLWEDFTQKIIRGFKMYNSDLVRKLGGFSANKLGKIDKLLKKKIESSNFSTIRDKKSVVGVHSCPSWEDQVQYEKLWTDNAVVKHRKTTRSNMKKYDKDLCYQYSLSDDFLVNLNRQNKTKFYRFIKKRI
tara:strand:+ start:10 stop:681 length:672 start_codon:yes stop_codon:yes gene_type:complete